MVHGPKPPRGARCQWSVPPPARWSARWRMPNAPISIVPGSRRQRLPPVAQGVGVRPRQGHAQGRGPAARTADAIAPCSPRNRASRCRSEGRGVGGRRRDRLVCRRGAPHLWPRGAAVPRASTSLSSRNRLSGRRIHTVELPDQPGRAETLLCTRVRMFHHRQGAGRNPRSPAELIRCFADAGVPAGVMNWYMACRRRSRYLIPHPIIRKMSFTGSTAVGNSLPRSPGRI